MLPEELNKIISEVVNRKSELQYIELKKAKSGTPERLYDTLSSFANQCGGGMIIFGIDEKNNYDVCGVYDVHDLQTKVTQQALQMEPVVRPVFTVTEYNGSYVVSAEISECDTVQKPCFYKGAGRLRGSYIRVGDSDEPMTEYEIYSYEVYKKKIRDELRTIDRASKDDFNNDLLDEYFLKIRREKTNLARHDKDKVLTLQGMTADERPTVAGLMVLGDYPQAFFPQLSITAMVVDGTEIGEISNSGERFIDNKRIDGTIPQMFEEALSFVRRNMKNATIINNNGERDDKLEYPIRAVREIILNALIHRDYSVHTEDYPIRIIMYKNRIEVENPGGLYGRLTINDLGKGPADTRNPFLAGNLEIMIDTENRFSGIPTIFQEMKNAGLKPPVFESRRGTFKAILYNSRLETTKDSTKTASADSIEERILHFCDVPKSREEIAEMLGVESLYYIVTRYLRPMMETGVLKPTIPEKPKSKYQKYYSVK
ncbi:MAG: putative DNA binding domain-containing protein [Clostridia bacterium]|nr:putative DNA binding domain-containing protein [Clostridia bacterium]